MIKVRKIFAAALLAALPFFAFSQEKPWINSTVVGALQNYNPKITDDFYAAVNRDWIINAKFPQGYPCLSAFTERELQVKQEILALLKDKSLTGPDAANVQNLFNLYLDWEGRENSGIQEVKKNIKQIEDIKNLSELTACLTKGKENFMNGINFFSFDVSGDFMKNFRNVLYISSTSLSLSDAADYKKLSPYGKNQKEFNDAVILFALKKLGYSQNDAQKIMEEQFSFESKIASAMMTSEDKNSPSSYKKILNKVSLDDLEKASAKYPLVQSMKAIGIAKAKTIYLEEPKWLEKLNEIYVEENLQILKSYLIAKIAFANSGLLDKETNDFIQEAKCKRNGIIQAPSYEKQATDFVDQCLSVQLSKLYAKHCVDKNAKKRITKLIKEVIKEYKNILNEQDWLCKETKAKAIEKLNATKIHVAYPALWDNYSALKILSPEQGETFYSAMKKLRAFNFEKEIKWLNKIGGSGMWNGRIYQVNAFNGITTNSINIIAGILGGDFYRPDMKDEELYGRIGVIIGHEISHSFDPSGSQFDKRGAMKNWWTQEDLAAFKEKAQKLVNYYDNINSLEDSRQSGQIVQGEATADMGGVKVMLLLAKKKPGFDYKLFFESFAKAFVFVGSKELLYAFINDPHPFYNLRVNVTLQQYDEFLETYNLKPGDKMYLDKKDRIAIW